MSFHFIPHLPTLVAMVVKFFMCMRMSKIFISLSILICYYLFILINNQGKQHKIKKKLNIHCYSYQVKSDYVM